jgi:hypothetical protein
MTPMIQLIIVTNKFRVKKNITDKIAEKFTIFSIFYVAFFFCTKLFICTYEFLG